MADGSSTFTPAKPSLRSWARGLGYEPKAWWGAHTLRAFLHDASAFQCRHCSGWFEDHHRDETCDGDECWYCRWNVRRPRYVLGAYIDGYTITDHDVVICRFQGPQLDLAIKTLRRLQREDREARGLAA